MAPTLFIITDLENTNWLVYLFGEFARINRLQNEWKVVDIRSAQKSDGGHKLYYTKEYFKGASFVNKSGAMPTGETVDIDEELYVLDRTGTRDERFLCNYDPLWNAFAFLSRLEEYQLKDNRCAQGQGKRHPRKDKKTFLRPVVNVLFSRIESILKRNFSGLSFGEGQDFFLELSHDVDYVHKTLPLRLKQTAHNMEDIFRSIFMPKECFRSAAKALHNLVSRPSYWCFDFWKDMERRFGVNSVFYIYAKAQKNNLKRWLIDPGYDIKSHPRLQQEVKNLIKDDFEIGLHGSYESATNEALLKKEKEILEEVIGRPVEKVRQHWLNYDNQQTPYSHDRLFCCDSTIGFNDLMGFRAGCASQYHPYDHKKQKPLRLLETPLVIMDFNVHRATKAQTQQQLSQATRMIREMKRYKSAHVSVSWHLRACNSDYGWQEGYEEILKSI